jgi:septal ring factor EnvC (AmiA/AmiB activator)
VNRARRAALLLLLVAFASPVCAARSAADAKRELSELRGRVEALQKRLAAAEESQGHAADALKGAERAISEANRALREMGERSREVERRAAELGVEARGVQSTLATQQALLGRLLYQQYVGERVDALRLVLNDEDPNRIARNLHYLGYVSRARSELIAHIQQNLARVRHIMEETGQQARELETLTAEQHGQRQQLETEKGAREQVLARISQDIARQRREIGTFRRNEERLTRLVEELGRIITRPRTPAPRLKNERLPEPSSYSGAFEALKGRLALPVRGELVNRFGSPRPDGGPAWKGVFIIARAGDEVRAVAGGRVVFAEWLRGFGNLLILDHGGAYMSLYGNNETLYGRVGDEVQAGVAIATVGNTGGNAESGLYFELRHQGRPLDPLSWIVQ